MSRQVTLTLEDIDELAEGTRINVPLYDDEEIWIDGADLNDDQLELLRLGEPVELDDLDITLVPED